MTKTPGLFQAAREEYSTNSRKSIASLMAEDARTLEALKKASAEAKQRAAKAGVPFIGGKEKSRVVPQ